jgi:YebC/PmpR family DNA-binding regulatory protein
LLKLLIFFKSIDMSGHSKWANIKHRKERQDLKKGQTFSRISRLITIATKEKGGDPAQNSELALAVEKAKAANMPKSNIEKAIKKGTGEIAGSNLSAETWEAFGPGGVALLISIMTDNKNRTLAEIKSILNKYDGKLAGSGSVSWKFAKKGRLIVREQPKVDRDKLLELVVETGASDYQELADGLIVFTEPSQLHQVKERLEKVVKIEESSLSLEPESSVKITDSSQAKKILRLVEELEENDDVAVVCSDFDIPDQVLTEQ